MAKETCPACGGAGGGPFGRAGGAWDVDDYTCTRCAGSGAIVIAGALPASVRPGIAKTQEVLVAAKEQRPKKAKG